MLVEKIKIVLRLHQLEMGRRNNTSLGVNTFNKGWCVMFLWLANLAAVRNQPFRPTSVHVTLTPPIVTKTSVQITHI